MTTHDNGANVKSIKALGEVFVVIDRGAMAFDAWTNEVDAHASIKGDESTFVVYKIPLREMQRDSER